MDRLVRFQIIKGDTMDNPITSVKRSQVYKANDGQLKELAGRERSKDRAETYVEIFGDH